MHKQPPEQSFKFEKLNVCLERSPHDRDQLDTGSRGSKRGGGGWKHTKFRHNELFPSNSIRALIIGPSNAGKTSLILDLLTQANGLKFKNVYLFSETLEQGKYNFLRAIMAQLKGTINFEESRTVYDIDEIQNESVVILDDIALGENIRPYFSRGRHKKLDTFYLVQSYLQCPKIVRENTNFLVIFKTDIRNLKYIFEENYAFIHAVTSFKEFVSLCNSIWTKIKNKHSYDFVTINKENFDITDSLVCKVV